MYYLKHVFAILTLQTGTVAFSWFFCMLAHCIFIANVLSLNPEAPLAWIIVVMFVYVMIVNWIVAFIGAIRESQRLISAAVVGWAIQSAVWAILVLWSLVQVAANKNTCLETRCPEVLWLFNNPWRVSAEYGSAEAGATRNNSKFYGRPVYEPKNNRVVLRADGADAAATTTTSTEKVVETTTAATAANVTRETGERTSGDDDGMSLSYRLGGLAVSSIVSIMHAVTFAFSWMVLIGYRKELELGANVDVPTSG